MFAIENNIYAHLGPPYAFTVQTEVSMQGDKFRKKKLGSAEILELSASPAFRSLPHLHNLFKILSSKGCDKTEKLF